VAFVGLGGAGQRHARVLRAALGSEARWLAVQRRGTTPVLDAAMRPQAASLADAYHLEVLGDLRAALERRPDLVVVATPTALHRDPAMAAIAAGCAVLVEKPLAASLADARDLARAAARQSTPVAVGFQRRHHPAWIETSALVGADGLGRLVAAELWAGSDVSSWHPYEPVGELYAVRRALGGGVLATECHELDGVVGLWGVPQAVRCHDRTRTHLGDVELAVDLRLRFGELAPEVVLRLSLEATAPSRGWRLEGTGGSLAWDEGRATLTVSTGAGTSTRRLGGFDNETLVGVQDRALVAGIGSGEGWGDLERAVGVSAVIDAAVRSLATGGWEGVDPLPVDPLPGGPLPGGP